MFVPGAMLLWLQIGSQPTIVSGAKLLYTDVNSTVSVFISIHRFQHCFRIR